MAVSIQAPAQGATAAFLFIGIGRLPFVDTRLTNSIAEGLNRIIKIAKNRASGFRTLDAFSDIIFLIVGDLNIPSQIPACFRTI